MSHRLLSANGTVRKIDADDMASVRLIDVTDVDAAQNELMQSSADAIVLLDMTGSADGRCFSIVGHLTAARKTDAPTVWLKGDFIPDQVSLAYQCGISAVLVSDEMWQHRGEKAWINAQNPPVQLGYRAAVWPTVAEISQLRQG